MTTAAATQGRASAGVSLAEWPADCRVQEAHADLTEGAEARSVMIRERGQLDKQNARTERCASYYDDLRAKLRKAPV